VLPINGKHSALIIVPKMKETIPSDEAAKRPSQGDLAHVSDKPLASRKPLTTERYHGFGCVEARHVEPLPDKIFRYWYAASTA